MLFGIMLGIAAGAGADMEGIWSRATEVRISGWANAGSTCVPVEVARSCSARFKASWIRLIVSSPWGVPVVPIEAAGQPGLPKCARLRPDRTFQKLGWARLWTDRK